jgi:ornithine carbamoyltransferase
MDLLKYKQEKPFSQKHLLNLQGYSKDEILTILKLALKLKAETKAGIPHPLLSGKMLAMIFEKSSLRTRVSFEVGMEQLGGHALFIGPGEIKLGKRESAADTAKVLSRYVDGIMIRTFDQADVEGLAEFGSIPVVNGLTDLHHPCQVLADILTVYEYKKEVENLKLAFVGDGHNMAHSLMEICSKIGMDISIACPDGYRPNAGIVAACVMNAALNGSRVTVTGDPAEAVRGADAVYTDVWTSMGQEAEAQKRLIDFKPYIVDEKLFALAKPNAIFLHCLPAHRGEEVAAGVIDGPRSVVFDEAENRLHAQKAVLALLMGGITK